MSEARRTGITRRGFSGLAAGGIAATSMIAPAQAVLRGAAERQPKPAVDLVLHDERFTDAALFADTAREAGAVVLPTHGDLGALWFGGLRDHLGSMVRRIAGMGRHSDFWIMRQLAADKGLALKFQAEHDFRGRAALLHRVPAQTDLRHLLAAGDLPWAAHMAQHVTLSAVDDTPGPLMELASATPAAADHPGLLVTWVFA
jgi:hypothetical protein